MVFFISHLFQTITAHLRTALIVLPCLAILALYTNVVVAHSKPGNLEQKINSYIRDLRKQGVIRSDETTAWSVYDFVGKKKLVSINENVQLQSASMIKPFIGLAYFYKVKKRNSGRFRYLRKDRQKMRAMINYSSNQATNYFIDLVGVHGPYSSKPRQVEKILKSHAPGIFRQTSIVEHIPRNGRTYRNQASARDYSRFLHALWKNELPFSQELKRLMSLPNRDRIYDGVKQMPKGTKIYDKTGTTARLCGDMGIVEAKGKNGASYPYTFIAIIEKKHSAKNYRRWAARRSKIIRKVSGMVYDSMKKRYKLR